MSLVSEQAAFLLDVGKLVSFATSRGFVVTGGELGRSIEQQKIHFDAGRSKTMKSNHLRRLAVDLNFFHGGKLTYDLALLSPLGLYWEGLHAYNRAGMNFDRDWTKADSFQDAPHFERRVPE